jgi:hypothetical protein
VIGFAVGVSIGVATDNLSLWMIIGAGLGLVLGLAYDNGRKRAGTTAPVKVVDGATYTIVKRSDPVSGQRAHYWLGDNGMELELTDGEAEQYGLG